MKGAPVEIVLADVMRQETWGAALTYCASKSGKQDKAVAADIGIQDAVWSRCKTGQNALSGEQLVRLMEACGNKAPLYWLLMKLGDDPRSLRPLESETERALREANERISLLEHDKRVLIDALSGKIA
ncbi:MAG: hypothetical protein WKF61_06130 [Luteimonas sp.]